MHRYECTFKHKLKTIKCTDNDGEFNDNIYYYYYNPFDSRSKFSLHLNRYLQLSGHSDTLSYNKNNWLQHWIMIIIEKSKWLSILIFIRWSPDVSTNYF